MTPAEKMLDFQNALRMEGGALAKRIAAVAGCSVPTVYRRIKALRDAGAVIAEASNGKTRTTGPVPKRFVLVKEAPAAAGQTLSGDMGVPT